MNNEVKVLGEFHPSSLQAEVIEKELRPLLPPCCQRERISFRIPHERAGRPHPDNMEWHQDGGGAAGTSKHMIVWASECPTHLKTSEGEVIPTEPYTLIWFDNTLAFHKQPPDTDETTRWFVSIRCSGEMI